MLYADEMKTKTDYKQLIKYSQIIRQKGEK